MLFSIIIPTYNRAQFIVLTIQSVLAQTYPNFEIIVVDDGSTDNTEEIVNGILDKRIKYYKKNNEERAAARNYGTLKCKGDYVTFLDSDDILFPDFLKEAQKIIEKGGNPNWFHLKYKIADASNKTIWSSPLNLNKSLNKLLLFGNFLSCIGVFLKADIARKNPFNTTRELSGSEDHELWLRIASQYVLLSNNYISAALIDHENRSVVNTNKENLIQRQHIFLDLILKNTTLNPFISGYESQLRCNSYSYISLHLALTGKHKKASLTYLLKAVKENYHIIFHGRFFAIVKHLLLTY